MTALLKKESRIVIGAREPEGTLYQGRLHSGLRLASDRFSRLVFPLIKQPQGGPSFNLQCFRVDSKALFSDALKEVQKHSSLKDPYGLCEAIVALTVSPHAELRREALSRMWYFETSTHKLVISATWQLVRDDECRWFIDAYPANTDIMVFPGVSIYVLA